MSVIVRTRNRSSLLPRAIDDILSQTLPDVEIIVVDDTDAEEAGSSPVNETSVLVDTDRITLISRAGQPHGRWPAANAGLAAARGEFVVLHDDDDFWDPTFLATTVEYLDSHPHVGAVCSRTTIVVERPDPDGSLRQTDSYPFLPELTAITVPDMLRANRIPPISLLYRRRLHDEFGPYDESLDYLGDWAFYLHVIARYPIALLAGAPLAFWSHRPDSTGDEANSIAQSHRAATEAAIIDERIRAGVDSAATQAVLLHAAREARWLDERAQARQADEAQRWVDLTTKIDELGAAVHGLRAEASALRTEIDVLRQDVYRRTSVSDMIARPIRWIRDRRR